MPITLSNDAALHFANELRTARAKTLGDAEGWQELVFVFERLIKFTAGSQLTTLGSPQAQALLLEIAYRSSTNSRDDDKGLHLLIQQVAVGRNSEFHGGAAARRFAHHCVELSFRLEDGLKTFMKRNLGSVMSSPVFHVETWQMLSDVRRMMLENSFTWVPVRDGATWRVMSDHALVRYVQRDSTALNTKTVQSSLIDSPAIEAPELAIYNKSTDLNVGALLSELARGPVLVAEEELSPHRVVGIVTAFDLL